MSAVSKRCSVSGGELEAATGALSPAISGDSDGERWGVIIRNQWVVKSVLPARGATHINTVPPTALRCGASCLADGHIVTTNRTLLLGKPTYGLPGEHAVDPFHRVSAERQG